MLCSLAAAKSLAVVKLLVEHRASVDTKDLDNGGRCVPLIEHIRWGRVDVVRYLLEQRGIDIYAQEFRYESYDEIDEDGDGSGR